MMPPTALGKLRKRAERLVRLLDLEAPELILQREAALIARAAEELDPRHWNAIIAEWEETVRRQKAGLCTGCPMDESPNPARNDGLCRDCEDYADEMAGETVTLPYTTS